MPVKKEIHAGVQEAGSVPDALLVDVRNDFEYNTGHIPGSFNLALSRILKEAEEQLPDKAQPLYIYCQSGARSARAAKLLELMGYENVTDIGGIADYTGPREK
ncbi:MAG: rhodanese-like domain-containing protein [Oscillospiraceae bacterium]|nr:rhodanese-like domain-containing protein [Oscillospiraceae bacterium]